MNKKRVDRYLSRKIFGNKEEVNSNSNETLYVLSQLNKILKNGGGGDF